MLASVSWGAALIMWSTQWTVVSKSPLGWPVRTVLKLEGSWLDQMLRIKSSGMSGARLLSCLRNWDGLQSPISSVRSWRMRCSFSGDSRVTSSVLSVV
jgi:hypothetical protein